MSITRSWRGVWANDTTFYSTSLFHILTFKTDLAVSSDVSIYHKIDIHHQYSEPCLHSSQQLVSFSPSAEVT